MSEIPELLKLTEQVHMAFERYLTNALPLKGVCDLTSCQALILHRIGDGEYPLNKLKPLGAYFGTNATYNVTKLVKLGYLGKRESSYDGRFTMLKRTERGLAVAKIINEILVSLAAKSPDPSLAIRVLRSTHAILVA